MRRARRRLARIALAALATGACLAAEARAAALPFTATLAMEFEGLPFAPIPGSGVAIANGSGGGVHLQSLALPSGVLAGTGLVAPITDPGAAPIEGLQLTAAPGAGSFAETAMGAVGGAMPLLGAAKVCLFAPCGGAIANIAVPLSVIGVGGLLYVDGPVNLTVAGAPWTTGAAILALPYSPYLTYRSGSAQGPASGTSTTAQIGGSVQLVTPILVSTNINADIPYFTGFARLTLHFVPEPATLVLLTGGIALLGANARRR